MKKSILLLFLNTSSFIYSQTYKINYTFDGAGNQINKVIVFTSGRYAGDLSNNISGVKEEDKQLLDSNIKYFPNPVKEKLFLFIENDVEVKKNISIANVNGQIIYQNEIVNTKEIEIPFNNVANGTYFLLIDYNEVKKSYTIIKN